MHRKPKLFRIISISIIVVFLSEMPIFANPEFKSLRAPGQAQLAPNTTVGRSAGKSGPGFIDITARVSLKEGKDGVEVNIRRFPPHSAEEFLAARADALGERIRDAREKGHKVYIAQAKIGKRPTFILITSPIKDEVFFKEMVKAVLLDGFVWKEALKGDLMIFVGSANVGDVWLWMEHKGDYSTLARTLNELVGYANAESVRERNARFIWERNRLVCEQNDYFTYKVVGEEVVFVVDSLSIMVTGYREGEELIRELRWRRPNSLQRLGKLAIKVKGDIELYPERADKEAEADVLEFVRGFLRYYAVSDLHIADKSLKDNFGPKKEVDFMRLLDRIIAERSTLVIDGDLFELWQAKYGHIRRAYGALLAKLRKVRKIIYIVGNHDEDVLAHFSVLGRIRREARKEEAETNASLRYEISPSRGTSLPKFLEATTRVEPQKFPAQLKGVERVARRWDVREVILSKNFGSEVLRDGSRLFIDEGFLKIGPSADSLNKAIEDASQRLYDEVKGDLGNVEIVATWLDKGLRVYLEHGNIADPFNNQTRTGRIISKIAGGLERIFGPETEYRLNQLKDKLMPDRMKVQRDVISYFERLLALAELYDFYFEGHRGEKKMMLGFGHTHQAVGLGKGSINRLLRLLRQAASEQGIVIRRAEYFNTGTWVGYVSPFRRDEWRKQIGRSLAEVQAQVQVKESPPSKEDYSVIPSPHRDVILSSWL